MTGRFARAKGRVKGAAAWVIYHIGLHKRLSRGRALIVVFHRVDDRYGDTPLNNTTAEFAAYLAFFKRFYSVISLGELLDRLRNGDDLSGRIVITFDDGYLDNYREAAPILRRFNLPACFFVVTDFMGSTHVPWWDEDLGIRSEWMSWEQVRALRAQGFDIGPHTMSHVDLGVTVGTDAFAEISGSKARLERELDEPVSYFSYPYGRYDQMVEANRDAVRRAGLVYCLSAYGGAVAPGDDPYHLRRSAIGPWYGSPYEFGFEALFQRT